MTLFMTEPDPCPHCGIPMTETFSAIQLKGQFQTRFTRHQYCQGCRYAQRAYLDVDDQWMVTDEAKGDHCRTILRHIREYEKRAYDHGIESLAEGA